MQNSDLENKGPIKKEAILSLIKRPPVIFLTALFLLSLAIYFYTSHATGTQMKASLSFLTDAGKNPLFTLSNWEKGFFVSHVTLKPMPNTGKTLSKIILDISHYPAISSGQITLARIEGEAFFHKEFKSRIKKPFSSIPKLNIKGLLTTNDNINWHLETPPIKSIKKTLPKGANLSFKTAKKSLPTNIHLKVPRLKIDKLASLKNLDIKNLKLQADYKAEDKNGQWWLHGSLEGFKAHQNHLPKEIRLKRAVIQNVLKQQDSPLAFFRGDYPPKKRFPDQFGFNADFLEGKVKGNFRLQIPSYHRWDSSKVSGSFSLKIPRKWLRKYDPEMEKKWDLLVKLKAIKYKKGIYTLKGRKTGDSLLLGKIPFPLTFFGAH